MEKVHKYMDIFIKFQTNTLGKTESDIIDNLTEVVNQIINEEKQIKRKT